MVLEGDDAGDQDVDVRPEHLAEELEGVAQPLGGDAELVDRLDVRPAEHRLVGTHLLVGEPDPRRSGVADPVRGHRRGGHERGRALRRDEDPVVLHQALVGRAVELAEEHDAGDLALPAPRGEERLEGSRLPGGEGALVGGRRLDEDVEVADRAEAPGQDPQPAAEPARAVGAEAVAEHPPRRAHPAGGHAHPVELLDLLPRSRAGLAGQHPGEVEADDLAAGFGEDIVGGDARRLPDRQPRRDGRLGRGLRRGRRGLRRLRWRLRRRDHGGSAHGPGRRGRGRRLGRPGLCARRPVRGAGPGRRRDIGPGLGHRRGRGARPAGRSRAGAGDGECPLELRRGLRHQVGIAGQHGGERLQPVRRSAAELHLELQEAIEDPARRDHRDLVERELHLARLVGEDPRPAQLAHGHELDERRLAGVLEDQRPGGRRGPGVRVEREVGRPLELLAAVERRGRRGGRLDGDDGHRGAAPEAGSVARPAERAVGRVEVAVLDLDLPGAPGDPERPERARGREARGRCRAGDAVLELHLHGPDRHRIS